MSNVLQQLKFIESHASTILGIADPTKDIPAQAVITPAREMLKFAQSAIHDLEGDHKDDEDAAAEVQGKVDKAEKRAQEAEGKLEAAQKEATDAKSALAAIAAAGQASQEAKAAPAAAK